MTAPSHAPPAAEPARLLAAIVVVSLTLRPALTSVSPLLQDIRGTTGMSFQLASLLTVLPVMTMGAFALVGAPLGRRLGERHGIGAGLWTIALACLLRFFVTGTGPLILSAGLAGCGIALIQALIPGVIKRRYLSHTPAMMGLYSAAIMSGGGLGAALSPWAAHRFHDWHAGLGMWAVLPILGIALWLAAVPGGAAAVRGEASLLGVLARQPRAWLLALYFGLINATYASMVAWLPPFYMQHGRTAQQGGTLLACMTAWQVVAALALPWLARRRTDRRPWLALGLAAILAGLSGFAFSPDHAAVAWAGAVGFGLGGTFSLSLILALDHLDAPAHAGQLAAFVQGVGFMVAAISPFATGWVRDACGSFTPAWVALAGITVLLLGVTARFHPRGYARAMSRTRASTPARPGRGASRRRFCRCD